MLRRRRAIVVGGVLAIGALAATATATWPASAAKGVTAVRPVVFVAPGTSDADAEAAADEADAAAEEAVAFLSANGVDLDVRPAHVVTEHDLGAILVDYDEALDACTAPRWQRALAKVDATDDAEIPVVVGGVIRSPEPFLVFAGVACGSHVGQCRSDAPLTGVVLVDRAPNERIERSALMAHEIAHVLGLGHSDIPGACGADLAGATPAGGNLMSEVVHAGLAPPGTERRQIQLEDLVLSDAQREVLAASLTR